MSMVKSRNENIILWFPPYILCQCKHSIESMSLVFAFLELGMVLTINLKFLAFILLALEHFQVSSLLSV